MKVLDLLCSADHRFEGWFASEDDFQNQLERGLVQCPMCGRADVRKGLSAPRLNLKSSAAHDTAAARRDGVPMPADSGQRAPVAAQVAPPPQMPAELQEAWLRVARHVIANTENVGERFANEARRMHYGDAPERGIRGHATAEETAELMEEGIDVMPFVLPDALKETLQ
ncbi:DUF1178 family protein [Diaphorobacter ruginosibacter]|uniref:DUF1178 family protein n=1 Tax=Diaphorobacter ruginosibacter TaxID=1715720 RepID=A0A7G9RRT9_9BURK|nr:DUF1178 family protein [Diaphorobacter ruginosibacter]QNN58314.1 DUF1178 family protein [Diaphorobacter ruginosibacter]